MSDERIGTRVVSQCASARVVAIEDDAIHCGAVKRGHRAFEDEAVTLVAEGELRGLGGEFAIEYGCDGDHAEHDAGDDGDSECTDRSDFNRVRNVIGERYRKEGNRGHAGVMHGGDGETHYNRCRDLGRAELTIRVAQTESHQKGDDGNDDGDQD